MKLSRFIKMLLGVCVVIGFSGCTALISQNPISEKNEFVDPFLSGCWYEEKTNGSFPTCFYIQDQGDHFELLNYFLGNILLNNSKVRSSTQQTILRFINIKIENQSGFIICRYDANETHLRVYNITEKLMKSPDFKKLCTSKDNDRFVTASSQELRNWCQNYGDKFKFEGVFKRCYFKSNHHKKIYITLNKFMVHHYKVIKELSTLSFENLRQNPAKAKIYNEINYSKKWLQQFEKLITPEIKLLINRHLNYLSEIISSNNNNIQPLAHEIKNFEEFLLELTSLQCLRINY